MFFILSKVFYIFLAPFTWFLIVLFWFLYAKSQRVKRRLKFTAIFIILFFSNTIVLKEFLRLWEVNGVSINQIENYDVGIVLGGMFEFDKTLDRLSIRRGGDRIWQALTLYYEGRIQKILISGDSGYITDRGLHEAEQLKEVLILHGIPSKDIITENVSKNTFENAYETVKLLKKMSLDKSDLLLITSATHMRRSLSCFEKQGVICTPFSTDPYTGGERAYHFDEYFVPSADTFSSWHALIKEWVGMIVYKIMGYA